MRTVLSRAYEAVVQLRNRAFDRGLFRVHRAPVPVISVGNVTAGGSGKTPVVEHLVRLLIAGGWMPAVVTRGYRRESRGLLDVSDGRGRYSSARESGDEAMQIARKFPRVPVIACEKRIDGARHAAERRGAQVVVLDDAFQHRGIARDLDIVVFDATAGDCDTVAQTLTAYTEAPVVRTVFSVAALRKIGSEEYLPADALEGTDVFAFCGIWTPAAFERTLNGLGMRVRACAAFRDHHWYSADDLQRMFRRAGEVDARILLTTEKDAVRIGGMPEAAGRDIYYPELWLEITEGEERLASMLAAVLPARS